MAESGLSTVIQGSDQGMGFDPSRMVEMFVRLKEAKKESATRDLQTAMSLAEKGLIDPSSFEKAMKNWQKSSGIKLADEKTAKALKASSSAGTQLSGAQSSSPVGNQTAKEHPAGGVETQGLQTGTPIEQYISSIRKRSMYENLSAEKKAQADAGINELKAKATQGDEGARTQLMKLGELVFNKELERVASLSPEEKSKEYQAMHEEAMGLESPKEKKAREERFVTSLVSQGYTPEQASKEFEKPGSSGIKKTFKQMQEEADYYSKLQDSFGDEGAKKIASQLATGASLTDILPSVGNFQSHFAQQMAETERQHKEQMKIEQARLGEEGKRTKLEEKRVGLEADRLSFEKQMGTEKMDILTQKAELELSKLQNQSFSEDFRALLESVKAGIPIPKTLQDQYVKDLAKRVGMTPEESKGWIQKLTFGLFGSPDTVYAPDVEKGKSVLDQAGVKERKEEPPVGGPSTWPQGIYSFLDKLGMSPTEKKGETFFSMLAGTKVGRAGTKISSAIDATGRTIDATFIHPLSTLSKIYDKVSKGLELTEEEKRKLDEENEAIKRSAKKWAEEVTKGRK